MRGAPRFARYHDDPEQTALTIDEEGWFHSGDLGRVDAAGRVAFVGRLKDMLKVGGENVAAAEVETHLLTHPAFEIVPGGRPRPDARYAEVPAAFVQLARGATATERGADRPLPRPDRHLQGAALRAVRDEWPMSGTKIRKVALRERIAADLEAAGITEAPRITSER